MEGVDVLVVVPQGVQRLHQLTRSGGVRLVGRGPPVVARGDRLAALLVVVTGVLGRGQVVLVLVRVDQPAGPGGDIDHEGDADQLEERGYAVHQRRAEHRASDPEQAPRTAAPRPRQDAESGQREEGRPLGADRQPERHPAEQQPRAQQDAAYRAEAASHPVRRQTTQPGAEPVAVVDQAGDAAEHEERDEDVEQGEPGEHQVQPVEAEQQPRDAAQHGRPGEPTGQPDHDQDHQRTDHRRGDSPAERIHPERLLAEGDQPLPGLGVHDQRRVVGPDARRASVEDPLVRLLHVVADVAVVEHRPGVLGVVGLVEREVPRRAQVPHPQPERQQRHPDRGCPAHHRVLAPPTGQDPLPRGWYAAPGGAARRTGERSVRSTGGHGRKL